MIFFGYACLVVKEIVITITVLVWYISVFDWNQFPISAFFIGLKI